MKSAITAAAVVMAATALTWAQGGDKVSPPTGTKGPGPTVEHRRINQEERFKQMDKNGNGVIDKDEFKGPAEMFAKIDADNSGTITKEEFLTYLRKNAVGNMEERFKQMDKNGNGVIDKDEFKGPAEMFAKIDADNSGTITKEELQAARERRALAPKIEAPKKP